MKLIVLFLLWTIYFAFHSVLADSGVKSWFEKKNPAFMPYYRLFYNLVAGGGFILLWIFQRSIPEIRIFNLPILAYGGLILVLLGLAFGGVALLGYSLGEFSGLAYINGNRDALKGNLKTKGLNSWVRHPLYFATFMIFWGWFTWKQTDVALVLAIAATIYLVVGSILEEKKLVHAFGEEYLQYQKRVKMLIPFIF